MRAGSVSSVDRTGAAPIGSRPATTAQQESASWPQERRLFPLRPRSLAYLPFALAALIAPAAVFAQPSDVERAEARRHFQSGVTQFQARDFAHALEEFQSAYRIAPHPSVRKNMAFCLVELNRDAEALENFEQFLAETPNVPPAERRTIDRQMRRIRAQLADVTVATTPADVLGLMATVDGNVVSTARPVRMTPGHHTVRVTAEGYGAATREVDVVAGRAQNISLTLERAAAVVAAVTPPPPAAVTPPPAPPPPPPPTDNSGSMLTPPPPPPGGDVVPPPDVLPPPAETSRGLSPGVFYAVAGVTGAAAIAWGVCGVLALSADSSYSDTLATVRGLQAGDARVPGLQAQGNDEAASAGQFAVWSDIAMGVTLAGAVAGTILFLKTDFGGHRVSVAAAPMQHGGALTFGGSF